MRYYRGLIEYRVDETHLAKVKRQRRATRSTLAIPDDPAEWTAEHLRDARVVYVAEVNAIVDPPLRLAEHPYRIDEPTGMRSAETIRADVERLRRIGAPGFAPVTGRGIVADLSAAAAEARARSLDSGYAESFRRESEARAAALEDAARLVRDGLGAIADELDDIAIKTPRATDYAAGLVRARIVIDPEERT